MTDSTSTEPLADRLVQSLAENRARLEHLMAQESSRAIHEEFLLAESGTLPDRETRLERARAVSARAWLRHLSASLAEQWQGAPEGLHDKLEQHVMRGTERLEALSLDEEAVLEREGLAGDLQANARRVTLGAYMRLFAEGVGEIASPDGESGPDFGKRVTLVMRREGGRRREVEKEAYEAWSGGDLKGIEDTKATAAPAEVSEIRVIEAAACWSYVRILADSVGEVLDTIAPPASAS
jgi:hypothetical protein